MNKQLVQRVFDWNSKRYEQVHNNKLTVDLLFEEWMEWIEAEKDVDLLDALLDVTFVAYGAIWKLGETPNVEQAAGIVDSLLEITGTEPGYIIPCYAKMVNDTQKMLSKSTALMVIIMLAETQMCAMGLTYEEVEKAFGVVCDSNDSKTIKKTASDVKANVDKGIYFIPPEPRLQEILDGREFS